MRINSMKEQLRSMIRSNETVMYEGRPDKKTFILESIFNPMLPFALIWGLIDMMMLFISSASDNITVNGDPVSTQQGMMFMVPFMLLHMMPVWIYLGGVLTCFLRLKHSYYIVTDHAVYISSGTLQINYDTKTFAEMSRIMIHRGIFDSLFGVGDVVITTNQFNQKGRPIPMIIANISNYNEVYKLVERLQTDIYSDTMYPNDLRPETNSGYRTKYTG